MAEKINLGVFEFDSDKLQSDLSKTKSQLDQVSLALSDARKESKSYSKDVLELARYMTLLAVSGQENTDEYKNAEKQLKKLQAQQDKINDAVIEFEKTQRSLRTEYSDGIKALTAFSEAQDINLENYTTEGKSIRELRRESQALTTLRNEMKTLVGEESEEIKKLNAIIEQNTQAQKENVNENQKRFYQIGQYSEQLGGSLTDIKNSIDALRKGDFGAFTSSVQNGFRGMATSARTFFLTLMSNPLTAVITVLAGLAVATGAVVREFWNYNEAIRPMLQLTEQITKLQGEAADSARNQASAYTETFGGEFQDNLKTAKELVEDFGISYDEAFDLMTRGTIKGANVNGEFQDSIKEYGVLFQQAGYSAEEFVNILNAGADLGVYSDKLPDAIKEAQLSITEQTKATKTALVDAFGQSFTDDLLDRVNRGQTSVKDALFEISEEAERTALTQQQLATITADVFRGAGEDAGGAVIVFEALNYAVDNSSRALTELEEHTYSLAKANEELAIAKDEALKSDSIIAFQEDWKIAWTQIKTAWYDSISGIVDFFTNLEKQMLVFNARLGGGFGSLPKVASDAFKAIQTSFTSFVKNMMAGGSALNNILTGNFDEAKKNYETFKGGFGQFANDLKDIGTNSIKEFNSIAEEEANRVLAKIEANTQAKVNAAKQRAEEEEDRRRAQEEAERKRLEELNRRLNGDGSSNVAKATKAKVNAERDLLKAIQETNQALAERANLEAESARIGLAQWIANNVSKLESSKRLTDDLIDEENKRLDNLKQKQLEALEVEKNAKELRLQQEIDLLNKKDNLSSQEVIRLQNLNTEKELINQEFELRQMEYENWIQEQKDALALEKLEQDKEDEQMRRAIEYEEELLRLEEENATRFEFQKELQRQNFENELADLDAKLENESISYENYLAKKQNLIRDNALAEQAIEDAVTEHKIHQTEQVFGKVASLLGKNTAVGKAAGLAQATINTYQGVTSELATKTITPFDFALKLANVAAVLATGLKAINQIQGVKVPKAQRGMITSGASHANGGIPAMIGGQTPIELEGGEAIINRNSTAMFTPLLSRLNELGGGVRFASGGLTPSELPSVQNYISNSFDAQFAESISNAVARGASEGTYLGSQTGIKDLNTNTKIANGANH